MARQKGILVIVDPTSTEQPALQRGAWLAAELGLPLELFICDSNQHLAGPGLFNARATDKTRAGLIDRHRRRLEQLAEPLREQGLGVSVDAFWERNLPAGILRKIAKAKPRFVLKDTHYHAAVRRSIFSNTDWNLIRQCPAALWLVKPHEQSAVRTILAAVDPLHERDKPAKLDHKILKTARELAAVGAAEIHAVHAFDSAPVYAMASDAMSVAIIEPIAKTVEALRGRHQKAMNKLTARHKIPAGCTHLLEGETREVLVRACEEYRADVVIIGAVSRGALQRLALGNTAERVLDFVPCDLLIVKPDRARS